MATRRPSRRCLRRRSISSCLKIGCRMMSARIVRAGSAWFDMTVTEAPDSSQPEPEEMSPPNDSMASAICGADIDSVPLLKSAPVMLAVPAKFGGSFSDPLDKTN